MSYEPEPGFFYGAMYFSYALIVGFIIMGSVVFYSLNLFDYAIVGIPTLIVVMVPCKKKKDDTKIIESDPDDDDKDNNFLASCSKALQRDPSAF